MAIDTANKRGSSIGAFAPWRVVWPEPDAAIDQGDRQQTSWSYRGISASSVVTVYGPLTIAAYEFGETTIAAYQFGC